MIRNIRECIGTPGGSSAFQKARVVWDSEICTPLIWRCYLSNVGGLSIPTTLCARVLRSRYYPSGDILNCELKKGSSYVWQSIWSGIQTFKEGCSWRVGNGMKIDIWMTVESLVAAKGRY